MDNYKLEPVADDAPNRCSGTNKHYQCKFAAYPGSQYCTMHGGAAARNAMEKAKAHDYDIKLYQKRVDDLAGSGRIKNLNGEVALLRMTLEGIMNLITEPTHFNVYANTIGNLADKIHRVVLDVQKLEEKTGQMLSKDVLMTIADAIIAVITKHVDDADVLLALSKEIPDAINAAGSGQTALKEALSVAQSN